MFGVQTLPTTRTKTTQSNKNPRPRDKKNKTEQTEQCAVFVFVEKSQKTEKCADVLLCGRTRQKMEATWNVNRQMREQAQTVSATYAESSQHGQGVLNVCCVVQ